MKKKKRSGNRSAVPRTLPIFPAASLTASLKEFFLSFISVSWLKSIISSSANQFTLLSRSPAASRNGNVSEGSGESRLLRSGTATNTEHKLCPSAFVLAIHLLYCVSSRLYNSDTTNSPQWLHTLTHTFFPSLSWPWQPAFITLVGRAWREYSLTSKGANPQSN